MKTWLPLLLIAVLLALTAGFARAQQTTKVPRIGYLSGDNPSSRLFESFQQGLRDSGYITGQNIIIEPRFAYGNGWRLTELANELVGLKLDVIVTGITSGLYALKGMTKTIPIVMAFVGDPVAAGIVASLERPGGNITGIGGLAAGLGGKWLELINETVPRISRAGVLWNNVSERESPTLKGVEDAARSLKIELQTAEARSRRDVGSAFAWATRGQADALLVLPDLLFGGNPGYIADLALKRRIPGIFWREDFAQAGGFMAYGANRADQWRRAAFVVDKIVKGANPAELPIELPKKFELVINLKTAKEIGISVPPRVLAWADKVIK
jgi:putative ABC transport system substrate-binding protein